MGLMEILLGVFLSLSGLDSDESMSTRTLSLFFFPQPYSYVTLLFRPGVGSILFCPHVYPVKFVGRKGCSVTPSTMSERILAQRFLCSSYLCSVNC